MRRFYILILSVMWTPPLTAQPIITKIVVNGDILPGGAAVTFLNTAPFINASGNVSFTATAGGNFAMYRTMGTAIQRVVGIGDILPSETQPVDSFSFPIAFNSSGQTAFEAIYSNGSEGLYTATAVGIITPIARQGTASPGGGGNFGFFESLRQNEPGHVAFVASLPSGGSGIFSNASGSLTRVVRNGDAVPGGGVFGSFASVALNNNGDLAFDSAGIFTANSAGTLTKIARIGETFPGTSFTYDSFGSPRLNDAGTVLFGTTVQTPQGFRGGIVRAEAGSLSKVLLAGDPAPNSGGQTFDGQARDLSLNAAGNCAFIAGVTGGSGGFGVFNQIGGTLSKVALRGDAAPGTTSTFSTFGLITPINAGNRVAFTATLPLGGAVNSANDGGLWVQEPGGSLVLLVREGQLFDFDGAGPGTQMKTVSQISFEGSANLQQNGPIFWTDDDTLAYRISFTDGTRGVYTASFAPIPEPGLLLLGLLLFVHRK